MAHRLAYNLISDFIRDFLYFNNIFLFDIDGAGAVVFDYHDSINNFVSGLFIRIRDVNFIKYTF